ncbi:hypothetical protein YC2023_118390 [Brassica napus]
MIRPLLITSKFVLCLHVPLCRLLVYKSGIGFLGGALAKGLSSWLCAWWSYELIILITVTNPELKTSVLSVGLQTFTIIYSIPLAITAASSLRVKLFQSYDTLLYHS